MADVGIGQPSRREGQPAPFFLVGLALLATISPFATDMYLPAFPEITTALGTSVSAVQLTLTTFLVGVAFGQLVFGPLSDRFGRKKPLLVGTTICVGASLLAALAPSVEVLLAARFIQGLTGAAGIVIARAIVADVYHGAAAARAYSLLAVMGGVAPIAAPVVGGVLAGPVGWRGILLVLCGLTVAMLLVAVLVIHETQPRGRGHAPSTPKPSVLVLLRRPGFTSHALIKMFCFMALMGYISASPFVFQELLRADALGSGLLFAANSVAMIVANSINVRLVRRVGVQRMLRVGLSLLSVAAILLMLLSVTAAQAGWLMVPLVLLVGSMGLIFGNTIALAIGHARDAAGTGSAFIGFSQFVGGAAVAPLVGLGGQSTATPLAVVVVAATAAAWVCYLVARRSERG